METTQGKAVTAYTVLAHLSRKPMNSFAAYKLFRLKKALTPIIEFQSEQEMKIINELGGSVTDDGMIQMEAEQRREYAERHKELENMSCEVDTGKIMMTAKELPEISVNDMEALDEFVEWRD